MLWSNLSETEHVEGHHQHGPAIQEVGQLIAFRRFQVFPAARQLLQDDHEVEIGSRAFDLLLVLLEARGRIVDKGQIFQRVWPTTNVEDSNLRFQMAVLRKILGDDRDLIKTVPGRGYMLAEDLPGRAMARAGYGNYGTSSTPVDRLGPESSTLAPSHRERMEALEEENFRLRCAVADLAISRVIMTSRTDSAPPLHLV